MNEKGHTCRLYCRILCALGALHCVFTSQMGPSGGLYASEREAGRVVKRAVRTMDSEQRLIQVISAMRTEIRKLELENMGLRRTAGANLRKNATVPIMIPECRGTVTCILLVCRL